MEYVVEFLVAFDAVEYTGDQKCLQSLDDLLQGLIKQLTPKGYRSSGDLIELKNCSWVIHERYFIDDEEKFKWTFHHTKFRILKSCINIINSSTARERMEMKDEAGFKVA